VVKAYLSGLGQGFTWANGALIARKSAPLFCPPATLVLMPDQYVSILDEIVKLEPGTANEDTPCFLLVGLQRNYPCR